MDILSNICAFASVAETGSFTVTARCLDLATTYVSRMVTKLEAHLQTRLSHRITRRIMLAEIGQRYLMCAQRMLAYIEKIEAEVSGTHV